MPKLKSNRSAAKRFKITGTGKVLRRQSMKSHILTKKTTTRKRHLRKAVLVAKSFTKKVRAMLLA